MEYFRTKELRNVSLKELPKPKFKIKKAIIFPVNKESSALLRYRDLLDFKVMGVYDEKLSGNVGKTFNEEKIKSFQEINWEEDFDTVILSCTEELSLITKIDYKQLIAGLSLLHKKNVYTFEKFKLEHETIFYPQVQSDWVPMKNHLKVHKTTVPTVCVLGTSSKQGKFSLQLELIRIFRRLGYDIGHISTEPSGFLFNSDYVFHCGYHSYISLRPWETTAILNEMCHKIHENKKDIMITGCQSHILHYNNSMIEHFGYHQYALLLGIMPDFCILCVNPHDDLSHISRTIQFINSVDEGKVKALVVFPEKAIETLGGIKYTTEKLQYDDFLLFKQNMLQNFGLSTYLLGRKEDMESICQQIISDFSE